MFKSRSYSGFERTSAMLNDGNPIDLSGNFSISFEISFWYLDFWGQILSMHSGGEQFLRVKYNDFSSSESYLIQFFIKDVANPVEIAIPKSGFYPYKWCSIEIRVNEPHTRIDFFYNDAFAGSLNSPSAIPDTLNFTFGVTHTGPFQFFEVPAMVLRDIVITQEDEVTHEWILNPQKSDFAVDSENGMPILIKNPSWLIDAHYRWMFIEQYNTPVKPSFAYDSESGRVFIDDKNFLRVYNLRTGVDSIITYENPRPGAEVYLEYDNDKNLLCSTHIGRSFVSTFDFKTRRWAEYDTTQDVDLHYYRHSFWYDQMTKSLYAIGGYGWYTVKGSLFRYNADRNEWVHVPYQNGGFLPQHYIMFGKGFHEGEYLLFHGGGNESGKQEEDFRPLPDLFSFSLKDSVMRKIASFDITGVPIYSSTNLCLFPEDSTFFSIFENWHGDSTNFSLFLYKWNIPNRSHSIVAKEFIFDKKNDNYSNLYYSDLSKSFYLFVWSCKEQKTKLYTLRYPPLETDPLILKAESTFPIFVFIFIFCGVVLFVVIAAWKKYIIRSKKQNGFKTPAIVSEYDEITLHTVESEPETAGTGTAPANNGSEFVFRKNCLLLFGGFALFNDAGENLALQFSARIKEIFLLIAIRSFASPQSAGITSEELSAAIWPEYAYESAKSNRNVSISKIRKLIEQVSGLKLEFSAKIWKLIINEDFYCDFADYHSIINGSGFGPQLNEVKLEPLLTIAEKGEFLSGISYDWLDSYKATINSGIISTLKKHLAVFTEIADSEKIVRTCNAILIIDSVDEETFLKKMGFFILKGQSGRAKNFFDLFASEYRRLYDEEYPNSFQQITERFKTS